MNYDMYSYVRNYFRNKFPEYYLLCGETPLASQHENALREIIDSILKNELSSRKEMSDVERLQFINSRLESLVYSALDNRMNNYFSEAERQKCSDFFNYVSNDYFTSKYRDKVSESVLRNMTGQIASELYYKYASILDITAELDAYIENCYRKLYASLVKKVRKSIDAVLIDEVDMSCFLLDGFNFKELGDAVLDFVMREIPYESIQALDSKNKLSSKIRTGIKKCINQYILEHSEPVVKEKRELTPFEYIRNYLLVIYRDQLSENDIEECAHFIDSRLVGELGVNPEDILQGKMNDRIERNVSVYIHSCRLDSIPVNEKLEYVPKVQRVAKPIYSLLLASVIFTLSTVQAVSTTIGLSLENVNKKVSRIMDADGFGRTISSTYEYETSLLSETILNTYYDKYQQYADERYDGIPFAEAYMNMQTDYNLVLMDDALKDVRTMAFLNDETIGFGATLTGQSCFLDYMYSCLEKMGFTEIKEERYQRLLNAYVQDRINHPDDRDYYQRLSPENKEILQVVHDKYIELSKKMLVEADKTRISTPDSLSHGGRI